MNQLLSKQQLAAHIGVTEVTIDRWRKQGMPWKRAGVKLVRFEVDAVNAWLEQHKAMRFSIQSQAVSN